MREPRVETSIESVRAALSEWLERDAPTAATNVPTHIRVPIEVSLTVDDPFLAYRRAREETRDGVFLETTGGQPGWGYFGVDPVDRLTVHPDAQTMTEPSEGDSSEPHEDESATLAALEGILEPETLVRGECEVPYPCGAIGWLSYDIVRELESLPESAIDDRGLPRLEVGVYDCLASWEATPDRDGDGSETTLRITACPRLKIAELAVHGESSEPVPAATLEELYDRGRTRALAFAKRILEGEASVGDPPASMATATFESECGREAFAERVGQVKAYVRDGDTFQANISQRLVAPAAVHPVAAYDALRSVNPAPYSALLELRSTDLVSASPELLLEREGSFVRTEPIAGTRARGQTPKEDAELEAELRSDEKERAEHAMLVDLERNDLGKVCTYGSVDVEEYRRIDRYSAVMHLVSDVTGELHDGETLADAVAAVFPGGTITGAPKPRTMEIIDELESTQRGPYTGSIGIFGFDGRATLNIVIRTLVRHAEEYHLRVGAGIVHDSDPSLEYDETLAKARALLSAVDDALGDRAAMALESDGGESRE